MSCLQILLFYDALFGFWLHKILLPGCEVSVNEIDIPPRARSISFLIQIQDHLSSFNISNSAFSQS